jgi:hypothetical protein
MPGRDRTGPAGAGPMTGRGMGICAANMPTGFGRGCRRGRGQGFGLRASSAPGLTLSELKAQRDRIQQQIDALGDSE